MDDVVDEIEDVVTAVKPVESESKGQGHPDLKNTKKELVTTKMPVPLLILLQLNKQPKGKTNVKATKTWNAKITQKWVNPVIKWYDKVQEATELAQNCIAQSKSNGA